MALKRNERYPGRYSNPTTDHPQGAFKNRTAPNAQDGSYLEQDWSNDWDGFFGRLLTLAGITPNGNVDTALASQYYDALKALFLQRTNPFGDIKADGTVDTALENLGLGNLVDALIKTNNLSDLPDKAVSRTNLGVPKGVDKQMANEWAVLSGITTVTIGDSLGISSIVRTALGTYTVNLSKPYSSINYAVMGRFIPFDSTDSLAYRGHDLNVTNQTTSSFTLSCPTDYGADYRLRDASELSFAVFGAKP